MAERLRILIVSTHPIQYGAPFFRDFSRCPEVELTVAYCSLRGAEGGYDDEFGIEIYWDVPLLEGYRWVHVPNRSPFRGEASFFGLINPGLWTLARSGNFDAVVSFVSYRRASFWFALLGAKSRKIPILFGTDASSIVPREGRRWRRAVKLAAKKFVWRIVFGLADQVLTSSTTGKEMIEKLGFARERVSMALDVVDNDWWIAQSARSDRAEMRKAWGVAPDAFVVLYCAKLQPWKRPEDLLRAFAAAGLEKAVLVFAGEGPLRATLEGQIEGLGLRERVRLLGFINQSQLPGIYKAADLMVLPSEYEPFGLVVNEAMCCGCPVLTSDQVGAVRDLIEPERTGFIYPCGVVEALTAALRSIYKKREELPSVAQRARKRIESWSNREAGEALLCAVKIALSRCGRRPSALIEEKKADSARRVAE
jgi:glycosyltransferase involved in cell wall biosynthesis